MTDQSDCQKGNGYYRCSLPPGACECPQSSRHNCLHAHWIAAQPTRDGAEGAGDRWAHLDNADMTGATFKGELSAPPKPTPDTMREVLNRFASEVERCEHGTMLIDIAKGIRKFAVSLTAPEPPADGAQGQLPKDFGRKIEAAWDIEPTPFNRADVAVRIINAEIASGAGVAEPVAIIVSDEDWQRALDSAYSCVDKKFISRGALDNAMQHAFGILSLRKVATPPVRREAISRDLRNYASWTILSDDTRELIEKAARELSLPVQSTASPDREAFYTILTKYLPQDTALDALWQELLEAGFVL